VGSHLSSRFLEQLSDTIVFPLWATLLLTATLPIPQMMHRTIGFGLPSARAEHHELFEELIDQQLSIYERAAAHALLRALRAQYRNTNEMRDADPYAAVAKTGGFVRFSYMLDVNRPTLEPRASIVLRSNVPPSQIKPCPKAFHA
jgi:hypothetical protein